jgi:SH3-like domain-containing protein
MHLLRVKFARWMCGAIAIGLLFATGPAAAQSETGLPLPRFVSVRADAVNMRTGPGRRYPIDWVLTRAGLPIKVIAEFEGWRQVSAQDGTSGWIHKSLLSGKRTVTIAGREDRIFREPNKTAQIAAFVEPGVVASLLGCEDGWCRITVDAHRITGWMPQDVLWGILPDEFRG